ncbi:hypothetical protein [Limobrevibacterium gyesilva]|uniref:Glutamine amidotransferase domain-containing protein n=1 Tax=Limobrevibacterium gyesilva TaxID=2991712 RepID=A0AA41YSH6_9PROT|nr:hypothetical protein [Limobrevibacterium gyesilva]MCW3477911.1 hypothetical protein [Limobrevibacterium gyesilva]
MHLEQAFAALRFDPALPMGLLAALAALCALALGVGLWRRARGLAWRFFAFAALLLWLSGPRLVEETRETLPDIGLLVIDQTASMSVGDRTKLAEAARARIEAEARDLPDLELRTVTVPEQGSEGTRLFAGIDRALADIPRARLAGIVAVTDGQVHDIPAPAAGEAPFGGAPLHVLIPAKGEELDRRIRVVEAPTYGIVGKSVTIRMAIEDLGLPRNGLAFGQAARLTIRRDGEEPRVESVPVGVEHQIDVPITRGGNTVVEMTADTLPGEISTVNNKAVVEINGVRDRLRVLLVSGEPHAGERTWRRLLKADPAVDLVHFTILRPPEKDDLTPLNELALIAFPVRELFQVKIKEFDLIILDRFQNRGILPPLYLRNIADYVRAGGALLMTAGPEYAGPGSLAASPLGAVLPARPAATSAVVDGAFRPGVTALGARHPVTEGLPGWKPPNALGGGEPGWGSWYRHITPADLHGDVLMDTPDGTPLLVLDHVEQGRAALLLSDQIWLWSRGHEGGGPQAELLRRVAHWLMKEPDLEETALTAKVEHGALAVERRSTEEVAVGQVNVTDPDGKQMPLALTPTRPGRAVGNLPATLPGVWQVSDGTRVAYAAAGAANPPELADLRATATLLAPLARASGGSVHWLDPAGAPALRRTEPGREAAGSNWIGLQRRHDHLVTGITAIPLLPPWLALPLILGLALLAWRREGA